MIGKFSTLAIARSAMSHTIKMSVLVHGDDEMFWLVTMAEASRLEKQGYEVLWNVY